MPFQLTALGFQSTSARNSDCETLKSGCAEWTDFTLDAGIESNSSLEPWWQTDHNRRILLGSWKWCSERSRAFKCCPKARGNGWNLLIHSTPARPTSSVNPRLTCLKWQLQLFSVVFGLWVYMQNGVWLIQIPLLSHVKDTYLFLHHTLYIYIY